DVNNNGTGDVCDSDCPDPELTVTKSPNNYCTINVFTCQGGGCEVGFKFGDFYVRADADSNYKFSWETKHVNIVRDDCHPFTAIYPHFNGDHGQVNFPWDGPIPGQGDPTGWTNYYWTMLERMIRGVLDPVGSAVAAGGNAPDPVDRQVGA